MSFRLSDWNWPDLPIWVPVLEVLHLTDGLEPVRRNNLGLVRPQPSLGADQLTATIDQIKQREGCGTVRVGLIPNKPQWAMRRNMLSQSYSTHWDELVGVRG